MNASKPVGVIECGTKGVSSLVHKTALNKVISKIYVLKSEDSRQYGIHFPNAEIVDKKELILQDSDIDHVIIYEPASEHMHLVAEVLKTGKKVQIIS